MVSFRVGFFVVACVLVGTGFSEWWIFVFGVGIFFLDFWGKCKSKGEIQGSLHFGGKKRRLRSR